MTFALWIALITFSISGFLTVLKGIEIINLEWRYVFFPVYAPIMVSLGVVLFTAIYGQPL